MNIIRRGHAQYKDVWTPAQPVKDIEAEVKPHLQSMYRTLNKLNGYSLAAQQVGLPLAFFIMGGMHFRMMFYITLINPVIMFKTSQTQEQTEADLTDPKTQLRVVRPVGIKVDYTNLSGERIKQAYYTGTLARVVLHEIERQRGTSPFRYVGGGVELTNTEAYPPGKESIAKGHPA